LNWRGDHIGGTCVTTAIYHAPEGDNKVVEMGGVTFFDGQPVDLNSYDNPHLDSKLPGNQHFDLNWARRRDQAQARPAGRSKVLRLQKAEVDQGRS
jgi:hypothetical protein